MHKINVNGRKLKLGCRTCNTRLWPDICPPFLVSMETLVSTALGERMIRSIEVIRFLHCVESIRFRSSAGGGGGDPRMLERRKSVRFIGELGGISCVGEILVENSWGGLESGLLASSSVSIHTFVAKKQVLQCLIIFRIAAGKWPTIKKPKILKTNNKLSCKWLKPSYFITI